MPSFEKTKDTAIIVGRMTGVGLDRDASLILDLLKKESIDTEWRHPRSLPLRKRLPFPYTPRHKLIVCLERAFRSWVRNGEKSILIPNQERFPHRHLSRLSALDAIFCKSHHAREIFSEHHPNAQYLGFTSDDRNLPEITPDYQRFFHLAGHSTLKGTEEVLEVWRRNPDWPTLTLVIHPHNAPESAPPNVDLISRRLDEDELLQLQNSCGIHLCPSRSEGWGHYIVEALSCAAVTVTTDAPPMNELVTPERGVLVAYDKSEPRHLGTNFHVTTDKLEEAISNILKMSTTELAALGANARTWFETNDRDFRQRFHELTSNLLSTKSS